MRNAHRLFKQLGVLLLAAILILQGLVPAVQPQMTYALPQTGASAEDLSAQTRAATGSNPNEMDGSKIEGIDIHWITPDSETANNGITGGSFVPLLALGIPGRTTTAVIMGAFMI